MIKKTIKEIASMVSGTLILNNASLDTVVHGVYIDSRKVEENGLYIPIIGIMFVLSAVSFIIQVEYYKLTKKRIFLMAPLHHHFEKLGYSEGDIVKAFWTVGLILSMLAVGFGVWI